MFRIGMFIANGLIVLGLILGYANAAKAEGLLFSTAKAETCSRYCDPARSRPCGKSCIPKDNNCTKDWTTACVGKRPESAAINFENPKHVDKAPQSK
jgi:hypothetical protein